MSDNRLSEEIDAFLEAQRQEHAVPGLVVGILQDKKLTCAKAFGFADRERRIPMTPDTPFWIGSCTKAFTALAVGILVSEGLLTWDTPVRQCLPEFALSDPAAAEQATVRDLLAHRTGLPTHEFVQTSSSRTRLELLRRIPHLEMNVPLRGRFQYNNLMYLVLGLLIERLSGVSWERFVEERILRPLSMTETRFAADEATWKRAVPVGYEAVNDQVIRWHRAWAQDQDYATHFSGPAGSIVSTVSNLAKWLAFHLSGGKIESVREKSQDFIRPASNSTQKTQDSLLFPLSLRERGRGEGDAFPTRAEEKQLVPEEILRELHTPQIPTLGWWPATEDLTEASYALGWWQLTYARRRVLVHEGGFQGFNTMLLFDPAENLGIILLSNIQRSLLRLTVPFGIYSRLLGLDTGPWPAPQMRPGSANPDATAEPGDTPRLIPETLPGCYENPGYGSICIERTRDGHQMQYGYDRFDMQSDGNQGFLIEANPGKFLPVALLPDAAGAVVAIEIPFDPTARPIRFEKVSTG
jgi:CubicO group peptidase (beta-lactamase class C family)